MSNIKNSAHRKNSFISVSMLLTTFLFVLSTGSGVAKAQKNDNSLQSFNLQSSATSLEPAKVLFQQVTSGLTNPVFITNAGDGSGRIFVVEQAGLIRIVKNGSLLTTPFLDIHTLVKSTSGEQGLLSLVFHPHYLTNGKFYVLYTAPRVGDSTGSNLVLEQFSVSAGNANQANAASGTILLSISHPTNVNHNGGSLLFGNDGYLYWSTGDGGGAGDPDNNAQNLNSLLGKILRIDVNVNGSAYGIPTTNPFYASPDPNIKKEIWAYGLRNPWRVSFDSLTHDLYIADVGQSAREEIDVQPASSTGGENYGWRVMEGSLCYNPSSGCDKSGKVLPVAEYDHSFGCSVTGGYIYRGSKYPSLYGHYFYGDYCSGNIWDLYNNSTGWQATLLLDTPYQISTFGKDEQGELYLADYGTGKIYSIGYQEPALASDTVGVFRPSNGIIFLKNSNTTGVADISINYGIPGDYPVVGDWNGDGTATIGVYRNGIFYLRNSNTVGFADNVFAFGQPGDEPIAGDWDGNGTDTIGVYRPSTGQFFLRNSNSAGSANISFYLGNVGDVAIAGDWDGDGKDTVGVFRPSNGIIFLKNTNTTGFADIALNYGMPGDKPVVGDWDNNGTDTIGVYRNGTFYLRNSNTVGVADMVFGLGNPGDMPIAGNWDGLP